MTILITGAAGFLGSTVCNTILHAYPKDTIIGVDNFTPYYTPIIKKRRISILKKQTRFTFIESSFFSKQTLLAVQKKYNPAILIHTAADVGVRYGEQHQARYMRTNVYGTSVVLETLAASMKHILLFSSSAVYGNTGLPFSETNSPNPISVYGVSKRSMELYAQYFFRRYQTPITVLRPFSIYGPDGRPDMLPMQLIFSAVRNQPIIISGKRVKRDWTYIKDFAAAFMRILKHPRGFQYVNIGRGTPITNEAVLRIAAATLKQSGYPLSYTFGPYNTEEMQATRADITQLVSRYNTNLPTGFTDGFKQTLAFFLKHTHLYADYIIARPSA